MATQAPVTLNVRSASAPAAERPAAKPAGKPSVQAAPERLVDVANFRLLPLSGAPLVIDDEALKSGLIPRAVAIVSGMGGFGEKLATATVFASRLIAPAMYLWSLKRVWSSAVLAHRDPTYTQNSKRTLWAGAVLLTGGAIGSIGSAVPFFSKPLRTSLNKVSGMMSGLAGVGFSTINLIETLRNPAAKPAEKMFAKLGFGAGTLGFAAGTAASLISMTRFGAAAPAVVRALSVVGTWAGVAGLATWAGQVFLGKHAWANRAAKATGLGR